MQRRQVYADIAKIFVNTQTASSSAATIMTLGNNIALVKRLVGERLVKICLRDSVIGIKCKWSEMVEET